MLEQHFKTFSLTHLLKQIKPLRKNNPGHPLKKKKCFILQRIFSANLAKYLSLNFVSSFSAIYFSLPLCL